MARICPSRWGALLGLFAVILLGHRVAAQGPTVSPPDSARVPDSTSLGPLPGSGGTRGGSPADLGTILGGRPGASVPRVPTSVMQPGAGFGIRPTEGVTIPSVAPLTETPLYGPLALPAGAEDEGPADGLTLDAAIERLVRENPDLRAQFHEIPMAQADILTASLRANPVFYADSQLIPYGSYSDTRPAGPVQYDVNVSYPLDLSRKRQARTVVARQAKRVIEAQYQDAVRQQLDNLCDAYVDVLGARETVRYARASVIGLRQLLEKTENLKRGGERTQGDVERFRIQWDSARIGLDDAEEALRKAKRQLAPLLRFTPGQAESLELRGTVSDLAPAPPPIDELTRIALTCRPDLTALRLGIGLAQADVKLALAERYENVYLLYQPYTFQNNAPFNKKSGHSWALGVTVPLPLYNRNQGNIERSKLNVSQTQAQLAAAEGKVVTDVRQAEREYHVTRVAVSRIERDLLPSAQRLRDETLRRFTKGEAALPDYLLAQREYNELVRQYRDTQVRHRHSMLDLNTAVGQRILP